MVIGLPTSALSCEVDHAVDDRRIDAKVVLLGSKVVTPLATLWYAFDNCPKFVMLFAQTYAILQGGISSLSRPRLRSATSAAECMCPSLQKRHEFAYSTFRITISLGFR